ncbi:GntR family transcriptional regulator, partial [Vibrio splendidus]
MKLLTVSRQSEVSSVNMNTAIKDLTLSANTKTRVSDKENTK